MSKQPSKDNNHSNDRCNQNGAMTSDFFRRIDHEFEDD